MLKSQVKSEAFESERAWVAISISSEVVQIFRKQTSIGPRTFPSMYNLFRTSLAVLDVNSFDVAGCSRMYCFMV